MKGTAGTTGSTRDQRQDRLPERLVLFDTVIGWKAQKL